MPGLRQRVIDLRKHAANTMAGRVVTVMSGKGGVGKTTLATELAWLLSGVLVDLDWDGGCASRALGFFHERYSRAPLLDALETGRAPRPRVSGNRPDLVPSHPDLAVNQPDPETLGGLLSGWAVEWQRPVLADTHPGGTDATMGAVAAADLVVMPVVLGTKELAALESTLGELAGYSVLLVPTMVPPTPPAAERRRLRTIVERHGVQVGPMVGMHGWLRTRKLRTVASAAPSWGKRVVPLVSELVTLGETVVTHAE